MFQNNGLQKKRRKLRAYSSKRPIERIRGKSVYDGATNALKGAVCKCTVFIDNEKDLWSLEDIQEKFKIKRESCSVRIALKMCYMRRSDGT